ncbi:hypothetical protein [Nocardioides sp. 616]|uniref:hypothetical protein n=1 Tax=Nocardioides sp. 616 TaxID=2268090 RepID=UPI000CE50629|nr:hypothetical protein [Nocardioides sp. 616]
MNRALLAVLVVVVIVVVAIAAWFTWGGDDSDTVTGECEGNTYELTVEEEDGGLQVTFDLQTSDPGAVWEVVIEQDGQPLLQSSRVTDDGSEIEVEAMAREDQWDEFVVTATPAAGQPCVASINS